MDREEEEEGVERWTDIEKEADSKRETYTPRQTETKADEESIEREREKLSKQNTALLQKNRTGIDNPAYTHSNLLNKTLNCSTRHMHVSVRNKSHINRN